MKSRELEFYIQITPEISSMLISSVWMSTATVDLSDIRYEMDLDPLGRLPLSLGWLQLVPGV